jgi:hypothetical protein
MSKIIYFLLYRSYIIKIDFSKCGNGFSEFVEYVVINTFVHAVKHDIKLYFPSYDKLISIYEKKYNKYISLKMNKQGYKIYLNTIKNSKLIEHSVRVFSRNGY